MVAVLVVDEAVVALSIVDEAVQWWRRQKWVKRGLVVVLSVVDEVVQ